MKFITIQTVNGAVHANINHVIDINESHYKDGDGKERHVYSIELSSYGGESENAFCVARKEYDKVADIIGVPKSDETRIAQ